MIKAYSESGYLLIRNFLNTKEVSNLGELLTEFHQLWQKENSHFYQQQAVNSANITNDEFLTEEQRAQLFHFIGSTKVMAMVNELIAPQPCFLNTQLFFNPVNEQQDNYWHRDPQYHLSVEQQKSALKAPDVIHFRLPLMDEPGIELVPGTHKRWDTEEELNVRLQQGGHKNNESLSQGKVIQLCAGDLLIFSANMIHRGLYGMDRLAFDMLFCSPEPSVIEFVNEECLPLKSTLNELEDNSAFVNTLNLKNRLKEV